MRKVLLLAAAVAAAVLFGTTAGAQDGEQAEPADASDLRLPDGPVERDRGPVSRVVDPRLARVDGEVDVVVQLEEDPLAEAVGRNAVQTGPDLGRGQQRAYLGELEADQDRFVSQARRLGARELARVKKALNAVVIRVDADRIEQVAELPGVVSVRPVIDYELDLSETVPYVGAAEVQSEGFDGTGVRVAVLDSGVDYTHRNLYGEGTEAAYEAAYGNPAARDGLFPTEKVYEGRDFVGEQWTGQPGSPPTSEDDDPIDREGHGTHVADITAGKSRDGQHVGMAPGAKVLAVKVCSALSSACEGVALLKGVDYALDPNRDGDISDAVDVINMSLGSPYGQKEDDLSEASANAVRLGVTVVASAGNSADRPYIVGSPSSTPEVISVAQTQVPGAISYPLVVNSPQNIAGEYQNTATVDWAPIEDGFTGDVAYVGRGCPAGSVSEGSPEDPYGADPGGKVALIDRGGCSVSLKVDRATDAGAIGVLIANNAPGDAPSFSFGGGTPPFAETLIITQDTGQRIKENAGAPVNVTVSPENSTPLVGSMVATSSRGPSYSYNAIKPDIGAPGASVSAVAGTGTGEEAFGGTSGAAPVVSGAAALLLDKYPARGPAEVKSLLMNTAETRIQTNPATEPGMLAPITRIGGGEVRANRAADSTTAAWDAEELTGSLSFGYRAVNRDITLTKRVLVRNYGNAERTYTITPRFRYADDARSGAVRVSAPRSVTVPRQGSRVFDVRMRIDASRLPTWTLNGGEKGGDGSLLQGVEFDGYLRIYDRTDEVHLAFHVLPHKAAAVDASPNRVSPRNDRARVRLDNRAGAVRGRTEVFSLTGTSPKVPASELPLPGEGRAVVDLRWAGARLVDFGDGQRGIQFGINTFGERPHPNYPAEFDVYVDPNRDGEEDYVVFNSELGGFGVTGQNVVNVLDVGTGAVTTYAYTDADLNSANAILTVPLSAIGLRPNSRFDFQVRAFDNYFTGQQTDIIGTMTYTPSRPRYRGTGLPAAGVPAGGTARLNVRAVEGGASASPSQRGLLLLYRDALPGREAEAIIVRR